VKFFNDTTKKPQQLTLLKVKDSTHLLFLVSRSD